MHAGVFIGRSNAVDSKCHERRLVAGKSGLTLVGARTLRHMGCPTLRARDIGASATSWVAAIGPSGSVWDWNPFEGEGEVGRGNLDLDGVAPLAPDLLDRAHSIVEPSQMG